MCVAINIYNEHNGGENAVDCSNVLTLPITQNLLKSLRLFLFFWKWEGEDQLKELKPNLLPNVYQNCDYIFFFNPGFPPVPQVTLHVNNFKQAMHYFIHIFNNLCNHLANELWLKWHFVL